MKKKKAPDYRVSVLALLVVAIWVLFNVGLSLWNGGAVWDVTQGKRYSLGKESLEELQKLKSPLQMTVYMSANLEKENPLLWQYGQYVLKFLEQYRRAAPDKIDVVIKNPEPYSAVEKEARSSKVKDFPDREGQNNLYFGMAVMDDQGHEWTIAYFEPARIASLENDVTRILAKSNGYHRAKVGVFSPVLPVMNSGQVFDETTDWGFIKQLSNDYDLQLLAGESLEIPREIEVLLVVDPREVSDQMLYALDQFVLRGGRLLILPDPLSEVSLQLYGSDDSREDQLPLLLANWGFIYDPTLVSGDESLAQPALTVTREGVKKRDNPLDMTVKEASIAQDHPISRGLKRLAFKSAGALQINARERAVVTPLVTTSAQGGMTTVENVKGEVPGYGFAAGTEKKILAAVAEGRFSSLFDENPWRNYETEKNSLPFLAASTEEGKVMVIADSDFLYDALWNSGKTNAYNSSVYDFVPTAENGLLIRRAVDFLAGNDDWADPAPRNGYEEGMSVGAQLVPQKDAEEYAVLQHNLKLKLGEAAQLRRMMQRGEAVQSFKNLEALSELERQAEELKGELRHRDYEIRRKTAAAKNRLIWLVTGGATLAVLVLLALLQFWAAASQRKQAMKVIHEK